jgi:hypothetical protein
MDTAIVIIKALCYIIVGFTATMVASLGQWSNEGTWPPPINWITIIGASLGGAAGNLLAFFSNSYDKYTKDRKNGNGDTQIITK